jgi:hypothetical protein
MRDEWRAKSAFLSGRVTRPVGFPLSCRFFIRWEPPNKNAASRAPFQERGETSNRLNVL